MLKKLIFKVIGAGFVLFGLSTYTGYLATGQLPSFVARLRSLASAAPDSSAAPGWSDIGALRQQSTDDKAGYQVLQGGRTTIYKWQDVQGHWQYGERAPLNQAATRMDVVTPAAAPTSQPTAAAAPQAAKDAAPVLINPYSADGVQQIMEKAREARQLMNEHNRRQEQL